MYYCETSNRQIRYSSWFLRRIKKIKRRQATRFMAFIKAMVTPESSMPTTMAAGATENRWIGIAKTLFWMTNAIIISIVLARICS